MIVSVATAFEMLPRDLLTGDTPAPRPRDQGAAMSPAERAGLALATARRHPAVAYGVAIVAVVASTLLKSRFDWIGREAPVAVYLGAVMLAAWLGGVGPGLLATALSALSVAYFFAAPYDSLAVASGDDAARLAIGAAEGAFISILAGALRRANDGLRREAAERLRAEEALGRVTAQMVHAQKMRAIGDFAGGIAHDFNNMLGVMFACIDLLNRRLVEDHPGIEVVDELRSWSSVPRRWRASSPHSRAARIRCRRWCICTRRSCGWSRSSAASSARWSTSSSSSTPRARASSRS